MKTPGLRIRQPKARGEWAELRFITRAIELKFRVSKPWGETGPYDCIIDHHGRLSRVQVKCTCKKRLQSYVCSVSNNRGPYSPRDIDFVAALIIPTETWYLLPIAILGRSFDVWLTPQRKNSRYAEFQEAWHLLRR
jgi:hypothetical protein